MAPQKKVDPANAGFSQPTMMVSSQLGGAVSHASVRPPAQVSASPKRRPSLPFFAAGIGALLLVVGAGRCAVTHFHGSNPNSNSGRVGPPQRAKTNRRDRSKPSTHLAIGG